MFKKDIVSVLVFSALMSGCSDSAKSTPEKTNQTPTIAAEFSPITEKSSVNLSIVASDDDRIASYLWEQVSGTQLAFTGGDSDTIAFEVPAITQDSVVEFKITVTDSEGLSASIISPVKIERIEALYSIVGKVVGNGFNNVDITATVGEELATSTIDDSGLFSLMLAVDDDVDVDKTVTIKAGSIDTFQLVALYPSITTFALADGLSPVSNGVQSKGVKVKSSRSAENQQSSPTVSISAVSTALFGLLSAANGGKTPINTSEMQLFESQINPDLIIEAAAVVNIVLSSEQKLLDEGMDLVSTITNPAAYNALVVKIEAIDPNSISDAVEKIILNPDYAVALTPENIAPIYYQTTAVAPTFVARSGARYEFKQEGIGKNVSSYENDQFDWTVSNNTIKLDYSQYESNGSTSFESVSNISFLTEVEKEAIIANGHQQVMTSYKPFSRTLTRIVSGSTVDTFRDEYVQIHSVLPIKENGFTFPGASKESSTVSNVLLRKASMGNKQFEAGELVGLWGFDVYRNSHVNSKMDFEILDFMMGGKGISIDSGDDFTWSVNDGVLSVNFERYSHSVNLIDMVGGDYSVFTEVFDNEVGEVITASFGGAVKIKDDVQWSAENVLTGPEHYYQTMVNQWSSYSWDGDVLKYCSAVYTIEECLEYNSGIMFGFQMLKDNTGGRYSAPSDLLPPNLTNYFISPLTWLLTENNKLRMDSLDVCYDDASKSCRYREWKLLKMIDGRLGKRIYVQEVDMKRERNQSAGEWKVNISPRWNMYELIEVEYFNKTASSVEMSKIGKAAVAAIFEFKVSVLPIDKVSYKILYPSVVKQVVH